MFYGTNSRRWPIADMEVYTGGNTRSSLNFTNIVHDPASAEQAVGAARSAV